MTRNAVIALTATGLALLLASQANALTLTNRELAEQRVQIIEGSDEPTTRELVLNANQSLDDLCNEGCTIALKNGVQQRFEGDENVYIEKGGFVIAE